jgi:glycosyltransferase involved in cell wall biosynthesis
MLTSAPDVLFVPSAALPRIIPKRMVTTIHDATFITHPKLYSWWQRLTLPLGLWDARRARVLIVPSEFTKSQIKSDRAVVIPLGVSIGSKVNGQRSTITDPYFLVVGRVDKKKNLELVIDAFAKNQESGIKNHESKLIIAGGFKYHAREIVQHAQRSGAIERIEFTGAVSDAELDRLYVGATALLHPCAVEGFGLPVIEAFSHGTPVVVVGGGGAQEAAGGAALVAQVADPQSWIDAMEKIADPLVRATLIEKGKLRAATFTWNRAAHETWRVLAPER